MRLTTIAAFCAVLLVLFGAAPAHAQCCCSCFCFGAKLNIKEVDTNGTTQIKIYWTLSGTKVPAAGYKVTLNIDGKDVSKLVKGTEQGNNGTSGDIIVGDKCTPVAYDAANHAIILTIETDAGNVTFNSDKFAFTKKCCCFCFGMPYDVAELMQDLSAIFPGPIVTGVCDVEDVVLGLNRLFPGITSPTSDK